MTRIAPIPEVDTEQPDFKPLGAQEARELIAANPSLSPWWVVAGQVGVGLVVALAAWGLTGRESAGLSAGWGALAVIVPAAVFARGLTGRFSSLNPATAVAGFFVWELVKIGLSLAMLFAAPKLIAGVSWPALLVGLILTMKVYWVALAFGGRRRPRR